MKSKVVPNSCRICLRKSKKLRSIYKPLEEGDETPKKMLEQITGMVIEEEDKAKAALPNSICKSCELSLNMAFEFRIKALKTQRIISLYYKQLNKNNEKEEDNTPQDMKEELVVRLEPEDEQIMQIDEDEADVKQEDLKNPFSEDESDYGGVEFLEGPYLNLYGENNDTDEEEESNSDSDMNLSFSSEDDQPLSRRRSANLKKVDTKPLNDSTPAKEEYCIELEQESERLQEGKRDETKKCNGVRKTRSAAKPEYDIEDLKKRLIATTKYSLVEVKASSKPGEAPTIKLMTKGESKPKKVNDEGCHICDVCGNIYPRRGRMMEHRKSHNKELRYACELCDKRFFSREKLRKHLYIHSGGKPFKCSFCSRTFYYESLKKSHEAVHSGHKPYVCEVCHKAFSYSQALKNHKLIHQEIKLYHCEYCDKDFRLQHHMKQHEMTRLHQNAVLKAGGTITLTLAEDCSL